MWPFKKKTDPAVAKCEEILRGCRDAQWKILNAPEPKNAMEVALNAEMRLDALLSFFGVELAITGEGTCEIVVTDQEKYDLSHVTPFTRVRLTTQEAEVKNILQQSAKRIARIQERSS